MYQYKDLYTIDFTNVQHFMEMHFVIRDSLDFPDYYGCNFDAFWDCLTDMYGEYIYIEIIGLEVIENKFEDAAKQIVSILERFKHYEKSFENDIRIEIVSGSTRIPIE